jgi:hypothetical protein
MPMPMPMDPLVLPQAAALSNATAQRGEARSSTEYARGQVFAGPELSQQHKHQQVLASFLEILIPEINRAQGAIPLTLLQTQEDLGAAPEDARHELPPKDPRLSAVKAHSVGFVRALRSKHSSVLRRFKARMNHLKDMYRQLDKDAFSISDLHTILFDHRITVENGYRPEFCGAYQALVDQCIYDLRYDFFDALFYHQVLSYEYQKQRLRAEEIVSRASASSGWVSSASTGLSSSSPLLCTTAAVAATALSSSVPSPSSEWILQTPVPSAEDRCDFLWRSSMLMLENGSADPSLDVQQYNNAVRTWTEVAYNYHGQHDEDKWSLVDNNLRWFPVPTSDSHKEYNASFQTFKQVIASMLLSMERYRLSVPGQDSLMLRFADRVQAAVVYHYPKTMDIKKSAIERSLNSFKMDLRHLIDDELNHPCNTAKHDCIASTRWMIKCILPLIFAVLVTILFYNIGWRGGSST